MHPQASNVSYIRFSSFALITSFTPESVLLNVHFWKSQTYKVQQMDATKALKEVEQTLGEVCHNPSTASHGSPAVDTEQSRNIKLVYICKENTSFVRLMVAENGVRRFLRNVLVYT
jgi:hypothetical protein